MHVFFLFKPFVYALCYTLCTLPGVEEGSSAFGIPSVPRRRQGWIRLPYEIMVSAYFFILGVMGLIMGFNGFVSLSHSFWAYIYIVILYYCLILHIYTYIIILYYCLILHTHIYIYIFYQIILHYIIIYIMGYTADKHRISTKTYWGYCLGSLWPHESAGAPLKSDALPWSP